MTTHFEETEESLAEDELSNAGHNSTSKTTTLDQRKTGIVASCLMLAIVFAFGISIPRLRVDMDTASQNNHLRPHTTTTRRRDIEVLGGKLDKWMGGNPEPDDTYIDLAYDSETGQCPDLNKGIYPEVYEIWFNRDVGLVGSADRRSRNRRSFAVVPNHTVLANSNGVLFNVETVSAPYPKDSNMTKMTQDEILTSVETEADKFYGLGRDASISASIEVMSRMPSPTAENGGIVFAGGQGFLAACMMSFANHLPLALKPDDLWTVITNGFARHVNENAEELRSQFVDHEGKKELVIEENSMVRNVSSPERWEQLIFPKFSEAILENINNSAIHETFVGNNFSTSTVASQAASEIALMATMKNYFEFTMVTMCGIPNIRLDGTREDWILLRNRTADLSQWMKPNDAHGDLWITDIVLPILDEFIATYDGDVNYCFWQNMVKFRRTGGGSGAFEFLSGWLPTLFPYLTGESGTDEPNPYLRPWRESASAHLMGPKPTEIPIQQSSVPVKWMNHEEKFPLHFHAGFRGVHQEPDGTLKPVIGWYVTDDPIE